MLRRVPMADDYLPFPAVDRNSIAGVVRAWAAARDLKVRSLTGCRLDFLNGWPSLLCYPSDREAYARLTRLLSQGQSGAEKGDGKKKPDAKKPDAKKPDPKKKP